MWWNSNQTFHMYLIMPKPFIYIILLMRGTIRILSDWVFKPSKPKCHFHELSVHDMWQIWIHLIWTIPVGRDKIRIYFDKITLQFHKIIFGKLNRRWNVNLFLSDLITNFRQLRVLFEYFSLHYNWIDITLQSAYKFIYRMVTAERQSLLIQYSIKSVISVANVLFKTLPGLQVWNRKMIIHSSEASCVNCQMA